MRLADDKAIELAKAEIRRNAYYRKAVTTIEWSEVNERFEVTVKIPPDDDYWFEKMVHTGNYRTRKAAEMECETELLLAVAERIGKKRYKNFRGVELDERGNIYLLLNDSGQFISRFR
jgi:hypothetical protein